MILNKILNKPEFQKYYSIYLDLINRYFEVFEKYPNDIFLQKKYIEQLKQEGKYVPLEGYSEAAYEAGDILLSNPLLSDSDTYSNFISEFLTQSIKHRDFIQLEFILYLLKIRFPSTSEQALNDFLKEFIRLFFNDNAELRKDGRRMYGLIDILLDILTDEPCEIYADNLCVIGKTTFTEVSQITSVNERAMLTLRMIGTEKAIACLNKCVNEGNLAITEHALNELKYLED